jgi:transposase
MEGRRGPWECQPVHDCLDQEKEAVELARRVGAYTGPYWRVVRAKIVLLAAQRLTNVEIAARLDTSTQVVCRWRKRFFEQHMKGLEDLARSGRSRVFPPSVNAEVKALAGERPATTGVPLSRWTCAELARELIVRSVVAFIWTATIWRTLRPDAIRPSICRDNVYSPGSSAPT